MVAVFIDAWSAFDPDATGFIKISYFSDFMFELKPPLGWGHQFKNNIKKQEKFFYNICGDLRTYNEQSDLFYQDVLEKITMQYVIR